jgi:hypothetical protein
VLATCTVREPWTRTQKLLVDAPVEDLAKDVELGADGHGLAMLEALADPYVDV